MDVNVTGYYNSNINGNTTADTKSEFIRIMIEAGHGNVLVISSRVSKSANTPIRVSVSASIVPYAVCASSTQSIEHQAGPTLILDSYAAQRLWMLALAARYWMLSAVGVQNGNFTVPILHYQRLGNHFVQSHGDITHISVSISRAASNAMNSIIHGTFNLIYPEQHDAVKVHDTILLG